MIFPVSLSRKSGKFVDRGVMCAEHNDKKVTAFGADFVAMAFWDLVENAMGAQDTQEVGDASAAAAALLGRLWRAGKQEPLEVAVAQAVDAELPAVDGLEQGDLIGGLSDLVARSDPSGSGPSRPCRGAAPSDTRIRLPGRRRYSSPGSRCRIRRSLDSRESVWAAPPSE